MPAITLANTRTGAIARIFPEAGFNLFALRLPVGTSPIDVLDADPAFATTGEHPTRSGIPLLFPFPNRIRGSRFQWQGVDYDLRMLHQDGQGNAIHGLVVDRPWRLVDHAGNRAVGQFRLSSDAPDRRPCWPADFLMEVSYELLDRGLRCEVRIVNTDIVSLPWGLGTHTYFAVPLAPESPRDTCLMQAPTASQWELVNCLPTGRRVPVPPKRDLREGQALAGLKLDDAYSVSISPGEPVTSAVLDPQAGIQVTQVTDAEFGELVAYTPPHGRSLCLEPYTCITDAINLVARGVKTGLQVLAPGEEARTWFEIRAGLIYA